MSSMGEENPSGLSTASSQQHVFKLPTAKPSLLGLDTLAKAQRRLNGPISVDLEHDDDMSDQTTSQPLQHHFNSNGMKNYRVPRLDTPSHPGGLNTDAAEERRRRSHHQRSSGIYLESTRVKRTDSNTGDREDDSLELVASRRRPQSGADAFYYRSDTSQRRRHTAQSPYPSRSFERDRSTGPSSSSSFSTGRRPSLAKSSSSDWETVTPLRTVGGEVTPQRDLLEGNMTPKRPSTDTYNHHHADRRQRGVSEWEQATPRYHRDQSGRKGGGGGGGSPGIHRGSSESNDKDVRIFHSDADKSTWDEEQKRIDRDWYGFEESGLAVDDLQNPFSGHESYDREREEAFTKRLVKKISARQKQFNQDNDLWERNRLFVSGIEHRGEVDLDFADEEEKRVHVMVHDLKPPFLDGRTAFSKQLEAVRSVKDPTSDLAIFSRKGSAMVRLYRERKEKMKQTKEALQVSGTAIGNIMGVRKEDENIGGDELQKQLDKANPPLSATPTHQPTHPLQVEQSDKQVKFSEHLKAKSDAVSNFARTKTLKEQREYLPVFAVRESLLQVIRDNQVVIIVGETGSGKTTQLTQYLHEDGYSTYGLIGCTQPRRVAAMSVAKRVSEEVGCKLGDDVGYAIRFEDCTSKNTVIKYMTDGVLLRESLRDPDIEQYSAIIMDEAHERSLHTDVLMGLIKKVVARRRDLKLIVTSATMDSDKFSSFFGNAPVFHIKGRTFPVETLFSKNPCEDYVDAAVKQVFAIHLGGAPGDILVFMTGQEDIEVTCAILAERLDEIENPPPLAILPIYSQLPADLQAKIFDSALNNARKVIVATNIAETSLTVDGIMYVVDSGYCKMKVYNPKVGMDTLQITPVSQANANQRSGRAGRTGPGRCYRLYTENAYKFELFVSNIPEIQRTNLANVVLLLKSLLVKNLLEFDFMDPPPQDNILDSMYELWINGALDNFGELTAIGKRMVEFPLDPSMAKMIIMADALGCVAEALTIVSMLSVPAIFYRPKGREEESDSAREKFFVPESDHLTLLNVYTLWKSNGYRDEWCTEHYTHSKALKRAREVRNQLMDIMKNLKMEYTSCGTNWDVIRKCIASSFFHQAARLKGIGEYVNVRTGMPCHLHPTSALYGLGYTPDYLIYHELVMTSKEYMMCVTSVDPYWLAEFGDKLFSIKESTFGQREKRQYERLVEKNMEQELKEASARKMEEEEEVKSRQRVQTPRSRIVELGGGSTPRTPRREPGTPFTPNRRLGI